MPTDVASTSPDPAHVATVPSPQQEASDQTAPTEAAPAAASATPDTEPSATEGKGPPPETAGTEAAEAAPEEATTEAAGEDDEETDVSEELEEPDDTMVSAQPVAGVPSSLIPLASKQPPALPATIPPSPGHLDSLPAPTEALSGPIAAPSQMAVLTAAPKAPLGRRKVLLMVAGVGLVGIGAGFLLAHMGRDKQTHAEAALAPVMITAPSNPAASADAPPAASAPEPAASAAPSAAASASPSAEPPASAEATAAIEETPAPPASAQAQASPEPERAERVRGSDTPRSGRAPVRPSTGSGPGFKPGGI